MEFSRIFFFTRMETKPEMPYITGVKNTINPKIYSYLVSYISQIELSLTKEICEIDVNFYYDE